MFQVAVSKPGASSGSQGNASEYVVRVPNDPLKKYSMIKFASGTDIDFLKLSHVRSLIICLFKGY